MKQRVDEARANFNSLGGIAVVGASGVPMGLGQALPYDQKLDAVISANLMGIPSVKGVSFGLGDKYAPTVKGVKTIDKTTLTEADAHCERADTCIVPNVGVIGENILAYVLLNQILKQAK